MTSTIVIVVFLSCSFSKFTFEIWTSLLKKTDMWHGLIINFSFFTCMRQKRTTMSPIYMKQCVLLFAPVEHHLEPFQDGSISVGISPRNGTRPSLKCRRLALCGLSSQFIRSWWRWSNLFWGVFLIPRVQITERQRMSGWGVQSPPKRIGHLGSMKPFSVSVSQDP